MGFLCRHNDLFKLDAFPEINLEIFVDFDVVFRSYSDLDMHSEYFRSYAFMTFAFA